MPHDRIIGLYDENAGAWDRMRGRDLHEAEWLERFAAMLPKGGSVLDIGCGMGEPVARWLIERGYALTGLDSSPSLIAMARRRFPDRQWFVGDMRALDLRRRFDGILAWHSFFHLHPDGQRPMFAHFAAHARHGAALMFTSGPMEGEAIGEWLGEPLYHASLAPEEYRRLLGQAGFSVEYYRAGEPAAEGPTVWIARQISPASGLEGSA